MAQIVTRQILAAQAARPVAGKLLMALSVPVLAVMLSVGMVDACVYTQHSLAGLYGVAASASV